jgi:hypothetical protein
MIDKKIPQGADLDFSTGAKIEGLNPSTQTGMPVEHTQLATTLLSKQDNVSGGSGIDLEGTALKVALATAGSDHSSLTISNSSHASLDGEYTRATWQGTLTYAGTNLDLDEGGTFNAYYKSNGNGVWAVCLKRDTDNIYGNNSVGESTGNWLAVLVTVDPASITGDYNSFVPNYQAVDSDFITASSEQDENGNASPSSADSNVSYSVGSTPAGLKFENDKLAIDFAANIAEASSTKVFPSSVIKTFVNEESAEAKIASNNSFNNQQANLAGNPANVQAALERVKLDADSLAALVSNNQTTAASEYAQIDLLQTALGASADNLGTTHALLSNNVTAKALIQELAAHIATLRQEADTTMGISAGQVSGPIGATVTDGSDIITAITEVVNALETVQGDLTSRLGAVAFYHNAEDFPLTAGQLAGTEAFNIVQTGVGTGESTNMNDFNNTLDVPRDFRILVSYGLVGDVSAGIYVRDKDTGYITRAADFDEPNEIEMDDVVQVLAGGSTAFADFRVANGSNPTVGVDLIKFELYKAAGVGDKTVTDAKLAPALDTRIENKTDKHAETVSISESATTVISHGLDSEDVMVSIYDSAKNSVSLDIEIVDNNTLNIASVYAVPNARVVVIG